MQQRQGRILHLHAADLKAEGGLGGLLILYLAALDVGRVCIGVPGLVAYLRAIHILVTRVTSKPLPNAAAFPALRCVQIISQHIPLLQKFAASEGLGGKGRP